MTAGTGGLERRLTGSGSRTTIARTGLLVITASALALAGIGVMRGFPPITDSQTDASFTVPAPPPVVTAA